MRRAISYLTLAVSVVMLIGFCIGVVEATCIEARTVNPDDFDSPQDNTYYPMAIGTTYVYMAETEDELIWNEITTTSDTKEIMGVDCIVVYDVEWVSVDDGSTWFKTEETYDWYAWDNEGNVWYFGEWTTEYEYDDDWNPTGENHEGSWEADVDGALPGIVMLAEPLPGVCYQQEYYEGEAEDMGKVLRLDAKVSLESEDFDDFEGCLKTKEWTPLDPGVIEHKYYAPGLGLVFIEELKEKTVKVELVEVY
ncbi:MAG: hypothetical protein OEW48_10205 [Phycisphaerae bacterium]|nr:hypothetical protein [Phycisphaerae bacterium]